MELVSGWIQHTVPAHVEGMVARGETIALVHADCDIYEPMKATILGCWPALAPGGIIVVGGLGNAELAGKDAAIADFRAEVSEVEFELDFVEVLDQGMKPTKQWFIRKRRRP